ncbi:MAG: hypothetical protein O9264_09415 [Leptospira sp.]|nr:hypothetical protein [Leptospira sp.]
MELFSLVLINTLFCGVMYVFISAKVQKAVSEYYDKKLDRAIDLATSETIRELDQTVAVIEGRLTALRTLLEKAEMLSKEFKHYSAQDTRETFSGKHRIDEVPPYAEMGMSLESELSEKSAEKSAQDLAQNVPKNKLQDPDSNLRDEEVSPLLREQRSGVGKVYLTNQYNLPDDEIHTTEGAVNQAFSKLGRVVKGMIGMDDNQTPSNEAVGNVTVPVYHPKTDYTVGGDPFAEDKSVSTIIRDENKEGKIRREFLTKLAYANDSAYASHQKNFEDQVTISLDAVLEELPSSATKIDKVVLLLKKGYTHEQISDYMNIGAHEIRLIETIRLDRSRRI